MISIPRNPYFRSDRDQLADVWAILCHADPVGYIPFNDASDMTIHHDHMMKPECLYLTRIFQAFGRVLFSLFCCGRHALDRALHIIGAVPSIKHSI